MPFLTRLPVISDQTSPTHSWYQMAPYDAWYSCPVVAAGSFAYSTRLLAAVPKEQFSIAAEPEERGGGRKNQPQRGE
jgi:hypothetical protein